MIGYLGIDVAKDTFTATFLIVDDQDNISSGSIHCLWARLTPFQLLSPQLVAKRAHLWYDNP